MLLVLRVQLFPLFADDDFFASVVVFHADETLVLEQIQRRVDHPRAGAVVPLGEGFDLFDQLIAVAGAAAEDVQNNQPQFAVAKETLATSAAAAAMFAVFAGIAVAPAWPTPLFMMMSHGYLSLFFDISNLYLKSEYSQCNLRFIF